MQNHDWKKTKEIFHQTLDLPKNERNSFLANQDDFVRSEVSRLLDSHEKLDDFIAEPLAIEISLDVSSYLGKTIGSYKIIEIIGTGGMGQVFLAEKIDLDKKFALKIIKRGMDTEAVLKRFVRERQILSRLTHPNIATLLDAGSTENDLPYFVMEYIEGESITRFSDAHQLDTDERLEIFQKVCNAVKYAHQNLIIHRDIKPSNILVTADGTPKLLDFGIAKLLNSEDFENTTTAMQTRMLTPEYASPEQINGLPITTATDVYSLGVVLYELLSGVRPFKSEKKSYQEIANLVLTVEPLRPSVISNSKFQIPNSRPEGKTLQNAEQRKTNDEQKVNPKSRIPNPKLLKGDLDNIILKALRKEPERRYQTVQEFSEDIRRYLNSLTVTATADSTFYRFSKFIKRNRIGTAIAAIILLLLGVSVWQGIAANRERRKAESRFEQVRKLANIVLFEYHDGIAKLSGATEIREKMVKDSLEFLDNLSAESVGNLDLQRDIAKAYRKVGDIQGEGNTSNVGKSNEALQSYQKAFAIQEKIVETNPNNLEDQKMLGDLYIEIGGQQRNVGDLQNTEKSFQSALQIFADLQTRSPDDFKLKSALAKAFWNIASLETTQNSFDESLENYQKALEIYRQLAIDDAPNNKNHLRNAALTCKSMGSIFQVRGENEKALQYFQKSLAIDLENVKNNPNDVSAALDLSFTYGSGASALRDAKNFQEAKENYQKAIEIREKIFNADSKNAFAENALARGLQELGRTYLMEQNYLEAQTHIAKAQILYQKMADSDAENYEKKMRLAENTALSGYVEGLTQNLNEANEFYAKSLTIYTDLFKQEKLSALNQRRFAAVYLDYGEILLKNKQPAKALENLNKAQELLANEKVGKDAKDKQIKLEKLLAEAKSK